MNGVHLVLGGLKGVHQKVFGKPVVNQPDCIRDPDQASAEIRAVLGSSEPGMIARFGSTELTCIANYLAVKSGDRPWLSYVRGKTSPWWWNPKIVRQMNEWSGFFPADIASVERFSELMIRDVPLVDLLGSWLPQEALFDKELHSCRKVDLELLNPYFSEIPWTCELAGKSVLVIHPFASSIESQYRKRDLIFPNGLLPAFELKTIRAVQSLGGGNAEFPDWFTALDAMKLQMDAIDYDVCLIGCGAYGFSLAAHAKRQGKKGFHLGGSLQLLFGIRGKRWENPDYNPLYNFSRLMNEHWIRPGAEERPVAANKVEGACYW